MYAIRSYYGALIDNLKLRLNLLYRLKEQLKDLNESYLDQETS